MAQKRPLCLVLYRGAFLMTDSSAINHRADTKPYDHYDHYDQRERQASRSHSRRSQRPAVTVIGKMRQRESAGA